MPKSLNLPYWMLRNVAKLVSKSQGLNIDLVRDALRLAAVKVISGEPWPNVTESVVKELEKTTGIALLPRTIKHIDDGLKAYSKIIQQDGPNK